MRLGSDRHSSVRRWTPLVAIAALAGSVMGASACSRSGYQGAVTLRASGVSVTRITDSRRVAGAKRRARVGDWVMASKRVSVVVGGIAGKSEQDSRSGAIVDLSTGTPPRHPLRQIRTAVQIEGAPVTLRTISIRATRASPMPKLRVSQAASGHTLSVDTDLWLDPAGPIVEADPRTAGSGPSGP
ncbi:MAG: hypothetical protein JW940_16990 [Polyangiaceae bacterium]|nr:hypothetical protein [Polyangiaceae bacterium]